MTAFFNKVSRDVKSIRWGWVIFWGTMLGWGISTAYVSYLGIAEANKYNLGGLMTILVIFGILTDLTRLGKYLPMTTIGPLPLVVPFVIYLMVSLVKGHDVGSLFLIPPAIYLFLYVMKLGFNKN